MTISETLSQASEALQQASAALTTVAQAMEDAPKPEPEPAPGEWRNDRAPKEYETDDIARVWVWQPGAPELVSFDLASFWYESCPARNYWAPGNRPAPKLPPPSFVASKEEVSAPQPEEWRSMPAPSENDAGSDGKVWVWHPRQFAIRLSWRNASYFYFMLSDKSLHWAPGNQPKPPSPPLVSMTDGHGAKPKPPPDVAASQEVEPQPDAFPEPGTPRTGRWIVDRKPTWEDADANGQVRIPGARQDELSLTTWTSFYFVHPGTPWCSSNDYPAPWDPTTLDRNGWIRSRSPTVEDSGSTGHVLIPVGYGDTTSTIAYHLIVPGQPWAPWGSSPGRFEK